jgi:hypothetical protein
MGMRGALSGSVAPGAKMNPLASLSGLFRHAPLGDKLSGFASS